MHHQTRSWAKLSSLERDARLVHLGLSRNTLERIRRNPPRIRILEAARIAFTIDDAPNSDLIEYIAGYAPRSAVYHQFASLAELFSCLGVAREPLPLPKISPPHGHVDLSTIIPPRLEGAAVYTDDVGRGRRFRVWQKVNGGMRSVVLNRTIRRIPFLSGIILYAGEGTKSLKSGRVEVANSSPSVIRLHIRFMYALGFRKNVLRARVQIHATSDRSEGERMWSEELGLSLDQFSKPMLSAPGKSESKRTFTLQLSYANTMLLVLLRQWTRDVDVLVQNLDRG